MIDFPTSPFAPVEPTAAPLGEDMPALPEVNPYDPATLLKLHESLKKEAMDERWVWEREWLRDLYYINNRQWIMYHPTRREWVNKRTAKWVPRPITNKCREVVAAIRAALGAINLNVIARPVSHDSRSIAAAEITSELAPLIHEEHNMPQVMREADFWLCATGNAVLQISWDMDKRHNRVFVPHEQCVACGQVYPPQAIVEAGNVCPNCGSPQFVPATDPTTGQPAGEYVSFGKGKTTALSPFEWAGPTNVTRFDELPYLCRLRWLDKHWFEANRPDLLNTLTWEKTPGDRSLRIFKSLAASSDLSHASTHNSYMSSGAGGTVEGVTEYEWWVKPTPEHPKGLVFRVIGDKNPILLEVPEESVPGPFPYQDIEGNPLFPFVHAQYEHIGGKLYGSSALAPIVHKQDQLNQLDSLIQLIIQRMANPVWVVAEGSGVEGFQGEPGWVLKWNPLAVQGQGEPKRLAGQEVPSTLYQLRAQILQDIEELSGTFDILKGQKPTGVEAFSALQLLVERSQSRFTPVFQSRGEMYRKWFGLAIELERQFGPEQRTMAVVNSNKGYTFKHFQNAQLQSQVTFVIEDGSNMPKTALGKRAAIEQANNLQLLDPTDPDQKHALLATFGLTDLVPTLNHHVQAALQIQDAFERWVEQPTGEMPLVVKPWFDAQIHLTERTKWLNTDRMRQMLRQQPEIEDIIIQHLMELQMILMPTVGPDGQPLETPGGGGMQSSNRESGATDTLPSGNNDRTAQNQGPR